MAQVSASLSWPQQAPLLPGSLLLLPLRPPSLPAPVQAQRQGTSIESVVVEAEITEAQAQPDG